MEQTPMKGHRREGTRAWSAVEVALWALAVVLAGGSILLIAALEVYGFMHFGRYGVPAVVSLIAVVVLGGLGWLLVATIKAIAKGK